MADPIVNVPLVTGVGNYPASIVVGAAVLMTCLLLVASKHFDRSGGPLTISLLITVGMLAAVTYCLIFTIPVDEITPSVVGGLTAGFGAVLAYWFGQRKNGPPPSEPPSEP